MYFFNLRIPPKDIVQTKFNDSFKLDCGMAWISSYRSSWTIFFTYSPLIVSFEQVSVWFSIFIQKQTDGKTDKQTFAHKHTCTYVKKLTQKELTKFIMLLTKTLYKLKGSLAFLIYIYI